MSVTNQVHAVKVYGNYINGEWVNSNTGQVSESKNPANPSEVVGIVQKSSIEEVNEAFTAANEAHKSWSRLAGPARGDYLLKVSNILEERLDEIALTMTKEMGKTFPEAKGEAARGVAILRYYAGEGMRSTGEVIPSSDPDAMMFTKRTSLGVVGVITPWNFPIAIPIWKMAPALVYGNTVVLKPANETSVTAAKIIECFVQANLPKGVINLVTGSGAVIGDAILENPHTKAVTFTGSNTVGKHIGRKAFDSGIKYQLEMGGKNPVIVTEDADLDLAVEATISGGLKSTGQKCTATSRVIVHEAVYEEFKNKLLTETSKITVGNGENSSVWMGPCASASQLETVLSYIEIGQQEGAKLLFGGERADGEGYFVTPAIFEDVTRDMRIAREEIFGPVLCLMKVSSMEEAVELANDSEFGLSASIFTTNIQKMLTFINEMDAGLVRVNAESAGVELQAPFGGMKQSSSHSREQGRAAIEFFTSIKTIFVK